MVVKLHCSNCWCQWLWNAIVVKLHCCETPLLWNYKSVCGWCVLSPLQWCSCICFLYWMLLRATFVIVIIFLLTSWSFKFSFVRQIIRKFNVLKNIYWICARWILRLDTQVQISVYWFPIYALLNVFFTCFCHQYIQERWQLFSQSLIWPLCIYLLLAEIVYVMCNASFTSSPVFPFSVIAVSCTHCFSNTRFPCFLRPALIFVSVCMCTHSYCFFISRWSGIATYGLVLLKMKNPNDYIQ